MPSWRSIASARARLGGNGMDTERLARNPFSRPSWSRNRTIQSVATLETSF